MRTDNWTNRQRRNQRQSDRHKSKQKTKKKKRKKRETDLDTIRAFHNRIVRHIKNRKELPRGQVKKYQHDTSQGDERTGSSRHFEMPA